MALKRLSERGLLTQVLLFDRSIPLSEGTGLVNISLEAPKRPQKPLSKGK
jgi:hypothetical protein